MFFYAFHSFLKTQWSSKGWKRSNVLLSFIQGGGTDLSRASVPRPQKRQISRISGYQNWGSWSQVRTAPQLLSALFQHLALRFLQLRHKIKHTHTHTDTHCAFSYQREFQAENEILSLFTSERFSCSLQGHLDFTGRTVSGVSHSVIWSDTFWKASEKSWPLAHRVAGRSVSHP